FFTGFMTFMFCYLTLSLVGWGMNALSPARDHPSLRKLLTLVVFLLALLMLGVTGSLIAPRLIADGERFAGWLSHVSPENEVSGLVESFIGPFVLARTYGDPTDPAYKKELESFRQRGTSHVKEYNEFPKLEAWVEGGFSRQFQ